MDKSKEFKAIQKEWYDKIKKQGFKDIEYDEDHLLNYDSNCFRNRFDDVKYIARVEYYDRVSDFLHRHVFTNVRDREIWRMHSEGMSGRQISEALKVKGKWGRFIVYRVIRKLTKVMVNTWKRT